MTNCNLVIAGAGGRMGRAIAASALKGEIGGFAIIGAVDRAGADCIGEDVATLAGHPCCGIKVQTDIASAISGHTSGPLVLIDFTSPAASAANAQFCGKNGLALVVGTTGFTDGEAAAIAKASTSIPIVKSGNMSTGIAILSALVEQAAARLGNDFDIEITEAHHRAKVDAPSGTGLMLGASAAQGRGVDLASHAVRGRDGMTGARQPGTIGFSAIRGGGIIGDHSVMFAANSETITLSHHAIDRSLFADGALRAAQWLTQGGTKLRQPGLYGMRDVLGL